MRRLLTLAIVASSLTMLGAQSAEAAAQGCYYTWSSWGIPTLVCNEPAEPEPAAEPTAEPEPTEAPAATAEPAPTPDPCIELQNDYRLKRAFYTEKEAAFHAAEARYVNALIDVRQARKIEDPDERAVAVATAEAQVERAALDMEAKYQAFDEARLALSLAESALMKAGCMVPIA